MRTAAYLQIGELASRVGVNAPVLRAWEQRYGVVSPVRSPSGTRLYSAADEQRLRRMVDLMASGATAREAARIVLSEAEALPAFDDAAVLVSLRDELRDAFDRLREDDAQEVLDRLFGAFGLTTVLASVVLPFLRELGDRWQHGEVSVGQEHLASTVVRARLLALARGWSGGEGARALLACPSGEQHDIGLVCFGLALRRAGWRITYLGQDTPAEAISELSEALRPDVVVLGATVTPLLGDTIAALELPPRTALALGGRGAAGVLDRRVNVLPHDALSAARHVAVAPAALTRWRA